MTDEPWVLAIDFGTSFTVAAARSSHGDRDVVEVIEIDGERRTPSVVVAGSDGALVAGRAAEDLAPESPGRVVREPKSRLGDPAPVVLGGRPYAIGAVVAGVLAHVYGEALRWAGGRAPTEVRLTHPATWGGPRRQLLLDAAREAGLPEPVLVPEPVAAAIAYAEEVPVPDGDHVLVYDLGGGTFDTAALRATDRGFVLVGRPTGDPRLGGELFDELLANHLGEQLEATAWEELQLGSDESWQHAAAGLRREARRVKEALSTVTSTFATVALPTGLARIEVRRDELEALVAPYVRESVELLATTAQAAGVDGERMAAISLVGGASRMPLVERLVAEVFPEVPRARRGDPKAVVAIGATHPLATPTRLAQHTSLDRVSELTPDPTLADLPSPTVGGTVAGTAVETGLGTVADAPPPSGGSSGRRRRIVAAVAAGVIAIGGVTAIAVGAGRGDGDDDATSSTTTTVAGGSRGGGPVVDLDGPRPTTTDATTSSTAASTTSTAPITVAPPTSAPPVTTPAPAVQTEADVALLSAAEMGPAFTAQPLQPLVTLVCEGAGSGIATVDEGRFEAARDVGTTAELTVGHRVLAYADVPAAAADYQALVGQLQTCDGATETFSGIDFRLEIEQVAAEPGILPPSCPDLTFFSVQYDSPDAGISDVWQTTAVFRCGRNGVVLTFGSLDVALVLDQVLIGDLSGLAAEKLVQLPGSLDT